MVVVPGVEEVAEVAEADPEVQVAQEVEAPVPEHLLHPLEVVIIVLIMTDGGDITDTTQVAEASELRVVGISELSLHWYL